jgi:hypothetical protein
MSDLIPFAGGEAAMTRRDIRVAQLKLDGLAEFNDRANEYLIELGKRAQLRMRMAPELQPLVADLLANFYLDAMSIQHGMYRRR